MFLTIWASKPYVLILCSNKKKYIICETIRDCPDELSWILSAQVLCQINVELQKWSQITLFRASLKYTSQWQEV